MKKHKIIGGLIMSISSIVFELVKTVCVVLSVIVSSVYYMQGGGRKWLWKKYTAIVPGYLLW